MIREDVSTVKLHHHAMVKLCYYAMVKLCYYFKVKMYHNFKVKCHNIIVKCHNVMVKLIICHTEMYDSIASWWNCHIMVKLWHYIMMKLCHYIMVKLSLLHGETVITSWWNYVRMLKIPHPPVVKEQASQTVVWSHKNTAYTRLGIIIKVWLARLCYTHTDLFTPYFLIQ